MKKGIFITGTGTDIGKTFVSALLVKKLKEHNKKAGYYKPALSGAIFQDGSLIPEDAQKVCKIANLSNDPNAFVSYAFRTPVSPHLAAQIENRNIKKDTIKYDFETLLTQFDSLVVEGCGGLFCPLQTENELILQSDIIKMLGLEILIVALSDIGTIHNTVVTVAYAKQLGLPIRGIVLNQYDAQSLVHRDNKTQIEGFTGIPVLSCVPKNASSIDIEPSDFL